MTWYVLKTYGGATSGYHLCEDCYEGDRVKTVQLAAKRNANMDDPERLINVATWHQVTMEDYAGTSLYELYCAGPCGEYVENPEFVPVEAEDGPVAPWEELVFAVNPDGPPPLKYFDKMPPSDPDEKPKKQATVKKFGRTTTANTNAFWNLRN